MNRSIRHTFLAATTACGLWLAPATAQTTATTDPVGAMTVTVQGKSSSQDNKITFLGFPFVKNAEASGVIETISGNELIDNDASWVNGEFANGLYYLRVTSGAGEGLTTPIVANTPTAITTLDNLSSFVDVNDSFQIHQYFTIGEIFGSDNTAGLVSGPTPAQADEILIYDPEEGNYRIFYYQTGARGGEGWRKVPDGSKDYASEPILVGEGLAIKRKSDQPFSFSVSGTVIMEKSSVPIYPSDNFIASSFPVASSLSEAFGPDGGVLVSGPTPAQADQILVPDDFGGFDIYYYQTGARGGDGYRKVPDGVTDVGNELVISGGSSFYFRRKGSAFNWVEQPPF